MAETPQNMGTNLREFVDLLAELRGVVEIKVLTNEHEAWIGLRTGGSRPAPVLLQQVSRAAVGFDLETRRVHFGILAD